MWFVLSLCWSVSLGFSSCDRLIILLSACGCTCLVSGVSVELVLSSRRDLWMCWSCAVTGALLAWNWCDCCCLCWPVDDADFGGWSEMEYCCAEWCALVLVGEYDSAVSVESAD